MWTISGRYVDPFNFRQVVVDDGIKKGEEILVSYGKGFWEQRKLESDSPEVDD